MTRSVFITAIHGIPIAEHWGHSVLDLATSAAEPLLRSDIASRIGALIVGNMLSGYLNSQENLAVAIADRLGMRGVEAIKTEAACASGAAALRLGYTLIMSGCHDNVLVVGVEKLCDGSHSKVVEGLALANDFETETMMGLSNTNLAALLTQLYCEAAKIDHSHFAKWVIRSYQRAKQNPTAMFRNGLTTGQYNRSPSVSSPLRVFDCPSIADGAVALILSHQPFDLGGGSSIEILGVDGASDSLAVTQRTDLLELSACRISANRVLHNAGCDFGDILHLELHDAYPIIAALSLEAIGLAKKLEGVDFLNQLILLGDSKQSLELLTFGGIKGRGHPVGATGLYQILDLIASMNRSTLDDSLGMAQCLGGLGSNCFTTILRKGPL